ncbi:MAG TPA: zinc ribbon domain-containing protein [Gemmatimonadaceae bacterium]
MSSPPTTTTCPACGAAATGRFCAGCGAAVDGATCAGCRAPLTPGARYCHRCGTPAGAAPVPELRGAGGGSQALPWAVAGIALLALIALVAGQRFGASRAASAAGATPVVAEAGQAAPFAGQGAARAPDISSLSPRERADRLFDRVVRLSEEGKPDSAQFFAPMALAAYQLVEPVDADVRYDMGRVGEITGVVSLARAQADTILRDQPNHLLGLILAARAARDAGDERAALAFERRFLAAREAELRRNPVEYQRHAADIAAATAAAQRRIQNP